MSAAVGWGLSAVDLRHHAVDESRVHPWGVLKAECGHRLTIATVLSDEPTGRTCEGCAEIQATRAMADNGLVDSLSDAGPTPDGVDGALTRLLAEWRRHAQTAAAHSRPDADTVLLLVTASPRPWWRRLIGIRGRGSSPTGWVGRRV